MVVGAAMAWDSFRQHRCSVWPKQRRHGERDDVGVPPSNGSGSVGVNEGVAMRVAAAAGLISLLGRLGVLGRLVSEWAG
jgi:hypothetical protein